MFLFFIVYCNIMGLNNSKTVNIQGEKIPIAKYNKVKHFFDENINYEEEMANDEYEQILQEIEGKTALELIDRIIELEKIMKKRQKELNRLRNKLPSDENNGDVEYCKEVSD
jgi:hypothetical protein